MGEPPAVPPATFDVALVRSRRRVRVAADQTILQAIEGLGTVAVDFFCRRGDCGTCVQHVVAGRPDHRDTVLSERAKQANKRIAICVSRSQTPLLELDL